MTEETKQKLKCDACEHEIWDWSVRFALGADGKRCQDCHDRGWTKYWQETRKLQQAGEGHCDNDWEGIEPEEEIYNPCRDGNGANGNVPFGR